MNANTDLQKIKDRIAKLLRMADDASSPNEAAIAATRARKLMDQYQLDHSDVGTGYAEEFATESVGRFYAAFPKHLSIFAVIVAKYNDCQAHYENGEVTHRMSAKKSHYSKNEGSINFSGKRPQFKGYKSDVELAVQMYNSLLEAVDRLRGEYISALNFAKYPVGVGKAFNIEAIMTIGARITAMTAERELLMADAKAGTSLILIKAAAVDLEFGEAKYKNTKTHTLDSDEARDAREAGRKAGNKIEITRAID